MTSRYAIINGEYILSDRAQINISDLSIQRGYGIFDFFRIIHSKPVFLEDHLDRFFNSADRMHLPLIWTRDELKSFILSLVKKNEQEYAGIRMTLTGGYSSDGYTPATPNLIVTQQPMNAPLNIMHKGISLITHSYQRQLHDVKTIDYLQAVYLQPHIKRHRADDVLYHNNGIISECPRSNIFMVSKEGEIITPVGNILEGITRKKVLSLTDNTVQQRDIRLEEVMNAREVFVTSTTKEVLPVLQIDGKVIGNGEPGKITQDIYHRFLEERNTTS